MNTETVLYLAGQVPTGVRLNGGQARLQWHIDEKPLQTSFERFLPVA